MNSYLLCLVSVLVLAHQSVSAQRLRKADRTIMSNMHDHIAFFSGKGQKQKSSQAANTKTAEEYISSHFRESGLKPEGDSGTWYQRFQIFDGKEILPATHFTINEKKLKIYDEYFPFAFSANKGKASAVAIALAEKGVPWFRDVKELLRGSDDSASVDTMQVIKNRAKFAANKGATALVVYNSGGPDIQFNKYDRSDPIGIPVIYVTRKAFSKYFTDESAIVDVSLNVAMKDKILSGVNVIGFEDNRADSTTFINTYIGSDTAVAALMELARLLKSQKRPGQNYLFVAYSGQKDGKAGIDFLNEHPSQRFRKVSDSLKLDTVRVAGEKPKELLLVKNSLEILKNN